MHTLFVFTRENIGSISKLLDNLVEEAVILRASDIHIDPKREMGDVRMRIDGIMVDLWSIEGVLMPEIVGRVKVLSGLRSDIHDRSQDGRFFRLSKGGRIDIRVSVAPTYYGENIVMRLLLEDHQHVGPLTEIGFSLSQEKTLLSFLKRPQGMIIVCGPTGSGKTSTLYSLLRHLSSTERSVVSLEDPVEYPMPSVRQIQLKPSAGFSFHQALRGVLRQDPDIIMVGEMRDKETASVAVQVALTGHLMITSIHAEDAAHILPRLIDMGIDPYLLAATVKVMIGQRLVRKTEAGGEGYVGRTGIFEVMTITDSLRKLILERSSAETILDAAIKDGYETMKNDGERKVLQKITTEEELRRVLHL